MTEASSPVSPAPSELAAQWHALAEEWARWYAKAASEFTGEPLLGSIANLALAPFPTTGPVDVERLVALNEKYRPRWEALWSAAIDAAAAGGLPEQPLPDVASRAPGDRRFAAREWRELPFFALMKQGYLLLGEYLGEAALLAPLPEPDKQRLLFLTKQSLDALAPTNFMATNPDALKRALSTEGASLLRGIANLAEDARRGRITMSDERAFEVGRNLAVTPGSVVYRNDLIELIQYAPTTARVHRRPLVIVPPCINKYYILDLQPENSFVRWAVGEGHTVFMISWRNIPPELGRLTWDDYIEMGVLRAIATARQITGSRTVNALGFCVGGTLLACALAVLAARGDRSVASVTLLTTMLDFADPGDIGVYVSREMLAARESALLGGKRMQGSELAGAFASLRANELIWNYVVSNYLKGETPPAFDLLYWNGDSSNLPGPMFAYYLAQTVPRQPAARARRADDGRRKRRPRPRDDARLRRRLARRPHRAVALGLPDHAAARRRRDLRAGCVRAHRRRRQPASEEPAQLLDESGARRPRPRTGWRVPKHTPEAGGRTGAHGSLRMAADWARRRAPQAAPPPARSTRRPVGYVREHPSDRDSAPPGAVGGRDARVSRCSPRRPAGTPRPCHGIPACANMRPEVRQLTRPTSGATAGIARGERKCP